MAINKTGSGSSSNSRTREKEEPKKAPPKPKDPPKTEKQTQGQGQPTGTRNQARNTVKTPKDGFETKTTSSSQRSQQQALLGSTTAPQTAAPTTQKGALEKLGLTADDLVKAGSNAAPHLEKAAQSALQGKWEEALGHLGTAATSSPEIAEKAVKGLAQNLPEGPVKALLTDEKVVHELLANKELHASVGKLLQNPGDLGAVRELIGNDALRDPVLGALGKDPSVQAQLQKIGLTPEDLVAAGKAAPEIINAFEKLVSGDVPGALTAFQAAVQNAPELAAKLGQKLLDKVPAELKAQFEKLGITSEALQKAGPALPHLLAAAEASVKGDWKAAYSHIKDAAAAAPELAAQALKGLANQLPAELGAAKSLLTNDAFLKELVSNQELQGSLEKLIGGDTSAVRELLSNDKARDAALTALSEDPGIKAQLEQIGLTPADLVSAGKAAPSCGTPSTS